MGTDVSIRALSSTVSHFGNGLLRLTVGRISTSTTHSFRLTKAEPNIFIIIQQVKIFVTGGQGLASYVRRFFAEFIDFIFAFFIKLLIIFYLVEMEVIDLSRFDKLLGNEADLQTLVDVTQELFPLELLGKLLCSLLEALCISQSFLPRYSGQTPGKYLMHVRVIDCSSVSYIAGGSPNSVRVTGVVSVPFKAALLRSILKNVLINSLVPFSTVAFAFNHNRAIYDLLAGTIVIED
ncbi:unnamed protein product [Nippostrongylus brasiliensis]|uniref:Protein FAM8A1 (inferred by orthology to a human protein) n=1 Tax=Nippostrongylus brasiliensis TaxID=27835 RepID=A0A0N4YDK9_NIPBR|nr:unnamed protein product [Nippostrongylus brasiliensis]